VKLQCSQQNIISVYIANILGVTIAFIDFVILIIILSRHGFEWDAFAYYGDIERICALICIISTLWFTFISNDKVVKPVFISALIATILSLLLFVCMKCYYV
jgi:hypothetical protein